MSYKLLFLSRSSSYTIVQTQIFCATTRNTFFFPYALLLATRFPGLLFLQRKINFYFRTSFLPGDVGWRKARDVHVDQEVTGKRVVSKAATQIDVGLQNFSNDHRNDAIVACNLRDYEGRGSVVTFSSPDCVLYWRRHYALLNACFAHSKSCLVSVTPASSMPTSCFQH